MTLTGTEGRAGGSNECHRRGGAAAAAGGARSGQWKVDGAAKATAAAAQLTADERIDSD